LEIVAVLDSIVPPMTGPNFRIDGKVALITGAGRGIGRAIARALASAGAAVAIQDIELPIAQAAAAEIVAEGGKAIGLGGDLTDYSICPGLIEQTRAALGGLHILVNNGAIQIETPWLDQRPQDMLRVYQADNMTPLILAQAAARIFIAQKWGRILNLGSVQQVWGTTHMLPYAMAKTALSLMTRVLARDLAAHGVTVNQLAPGYFNTIRNRKDFSTEQEKLARGKFIPLGRVGEPEDLGGIAVLLCSEAGNYITGQNIYVDGGLSVR
jgi:NAD(P)-dependent dehydrogenase (short-subunit alcohol dehydrogenase family)